MAEYPSIVLTNLGLEMIAESQAGQNLIFTKLKIGDGSLGTGESISTLTGVKSPKLDIPIQGFTNQGNGQVRLRYLVDNSNVAVNQGFFAREVGIYAKIGESGTDELYAYTNGGNKVDWIPDKNTPLDAQIFDVFVLIGNASNVTVVINNSATYATKLDLTEHNAESGAHGATSANTANAIVQRDASGNFIAGTITAALNGNAETATKLATGRKITLTGDVTGETTFDGAGNVTIDTEVTAGMPLGFTFSILANTPPEGCLALQGALVSRTAYPELWTWIQAHAPLITESAWQAQAAVQSSVGAYSSGDGSTNFRLPKIADFVRGSDTGRTPGTWQADEFKSHNHPPLNPLSSFIGGNGSNASAAPSTATWLSVATTGNAGGEETRPKSVSMLWCVKAFGAAVNPGTVDVTALAASLNDKIGKTDTGYGTHIWVSDEYTPVNNIPTIVNHGLTIDPLKCKCEVLLKCVTAQGGYSVGDYAISPVLGPSTGGAVEYPLIPSLNATSIQINTGAYGLACCQKANGNGLGITNANWRYIFRIWY